jgi:membrane-bound lytic murein transglycosylase D
VKGGLILLVLIIATCGLMAQEKDAQSDGGFMSLDDWLQENVDEDVLRFMQGMDQEKAGKLLSELKAAMQGTNIYRLGTLRQTATEVIPLLDKFEETAPYAAWLRARMDYLEAAERMEKEMKPGNGNLPPAPTLKLEKKVWVEELKQRPWPASAQKYVPRLKEIFIEERMPPELVWVAEVESSFEPRAKSFAGAAGMFQLMPETAKDHGLSLWPWDERLQPEKSARAAAVYLRNLYQHYGDWELALAAYNAGPGQVDKALKGRKTRSFAAIASRLPAETQMYVPKVEATIEKREGVSLGTLRVAERAVE